MIPRLRYKTKLLCSAKKKKKKPHQVFKITFITVYVENTQYTDNFLTCGFSGDIFLKKAYLQSFNRLQ